MADDRRKRRDTEKLTVRRARPSDKDAIVEMSRSIWGGHDYLPLVWDEWVADTKGVLLTVLHGKRPIGTSKISLLSPGEVWLEGLRLHPDFHGRGLSGQIHRATFKEAMKLRPASVRYSTWIGNEASRHIAETHGFWLVGRGVSMWGDATAASRLRSRRARTEDLESVLRFVRRSDCYERFGGLYGRGWQFPELSRKRITRLMSEGQVLICRRGGAIRAVAVIDRTHVDDDLCIGFIDGNDEDVSLLARDVLSIAHRSGRKGASAMLPVGRIADTVRRSGFDTDQPFYSVVYELGSRGIRPGGEDFAELVGRTIRINEPDIADAISEIIVSRSGAKLSRENVRDLVMRMMVPDTTRELTAMLLRMSAGLKRDDVRHALWLVVTHLHDTHGLSLSGDAVAVGKATISIRHMGRRLAHIKCRKTSFSITLGPGFGHCFPERLAMPGGNVRFEDRWFDKASGKYEAVTLVVRERKHAARVIRAIDTVMKSAAKRR